MTPDTPRRWGTLTAHEMLCHLGDATAMVLLDRPRVVPIDGGRRRVRKTLGLWSPLRWPHGLRTSPHYNPHTLGTPADGVRSRTRIASSTACSGLGGCAGPTLPLEPAHGFFGRCPTPAWQRWAFKHTDHHLRQFGL